jgi:AraC-like DNA-binding protein
MSWDFFNIFLLLAASQGFFLTLLIFHKHRRLYANRFLGILLLFYSIILLNLFLEEIGFLYQYPLLLIIQFGLPFFIGPLHYLYARYLTYSYSRFQKYDWLHFLTFIGYEIYFIIRLGTNSSAIMSTMQNFETAGLSIENFIFNWLILVQGLIYLLLTLVLLKRYSRKIKVVFSSIERIRLSWLRNITYLTLGVVLSFLIENLLLLAGINFSDYFSLTSFLAAAAVYTMGYMGLFKSEIFKRPEVAHSISQMSDLPEQSQQPVDTASVPKYQKSGLSPEKAQLYLQQLQQLMETSKIYVNSELTLNQLADRLSITPHNLSEVINTRLQQNFFDFINAYRLEEAKKDLTDPAKRHLKILSIAYDAGFNSKATFNTIFKKVTQMTPSEYREKFLKDDQ